MFLYRILFGFIDIFHPDLFSYNFFKVQLYFASTEDNIGFISGLIIESINFLE